MVLGPLSSRAAEARQSRADISIEWDGEFTRANGIRSGNGTAARPYVISGWSVNNIRIKDTTKAIRIMDNTITGTLTLDWNGPNITVMGNTIGDLRVNQNVARWGDSTSGMFTRNRIGVVGQLRHFDGMFMWNTVGSKAESPRPDVRAVNLDGWNNAHFARNTIYGYVDARIHGHHHSSEFGGMSHDHATGPHDMHPADHTRRFHEVMIEANSIFTSHEYGLAYLDTNHAANDRTANSETNPYLNAPHTHDTRAHIVANALDGSGILIDVFNAKDGRHKSYATGLLEIDRNRVSLPRDAARPPATVHGIEVRQARFVTVKIRSNTIAGPERLTGVAQLDDRLQNGSGIFLNTLENATVAIDAATISNRQFAVQATRLAKTVRWSITGLKASGVSEEVRTDASVANSPARR